MIVGFQQAVTCINEYVFLPGALSCHVAAVIVDTAAVYWHIVELRKIRVLQSNFLIR